MKNIEKYTNTKDALEVYESNRKNTWYTFEQWLDEDYIEPREQTLLEAAEAVANIVECTTEYETRRLLKELSLAIKREKHKPIRNCDKYRTYEEAYVAFIGMCNKSSCNDCRFVGHTIPCFSEWIYDEANKEVAE